jgi:hypothetical protein
MGKKYVAALKDTFKTNIIVMMLHGIAPGPLLGAVKS